jgi:asparagine synthase (glutamine-hydrolysing)
MDGAGTLKSFFELSAAPEFTSAAPEEIVEDIRDIVWRSACQRIDFSTPTAGLLSGGLDSSVVCLLASRLYREKFGPAARLKTFAMGVGESQDIQNARIVAEHIGSEHHELIVELDEVFQVLPEVIYHLESFDASLVRSAASNYLISRHAREHGIDQLLSGEGGDEVFCGYTYLKDFPPEELTARQLECLGFLHSNASLRLDRMNQCHGIRVVTPLISGELLQYALRIPPQFKMKPESDGKIEKWIFRKAYEADLPAAVVWRGKQEFSQGSGSADVMPAHFEAAVSDEEFTADQARFPRVRSKEELYYFWVFAEHFGTEEAVDTVGQWICL